MRNSRKSLALALAVVGVAGLSMASAAQLTVNSPDVVAGVDSIGACGGAGVSVTYAPTYTAGVPGYTISAVTLTGDPAGTCAGTVLVTVSGAANASLASGSAAWSNSAPVVVTLSSTVSVASIQGIAVAIS